MSTRATAKGERRAAPLLAFLCLVGFLTGCATTRPVSPNAGFDQRIADLSKRCGCRMGLYARHLESGRLYERDAQEEFESASVIKIAILTEAMARVRSGDIDLASRWTLSDANKASGSGTLLILDAGLNPTWSDLITLMIGPSDNTATNAWIDRLGIPAINERMTGMNLPHIRLFAKIPALSREKDEPSPWRGFKLGSLTPHDVGEWMSRVARGEVIDAETSRKIFAYLDKDPSRMRIARRFPGEFLWAGKTGSMSGVRNDSGILRTKKGRFVLVVLTDRSTATSASSADHPSVLAIADAAQAIVSQWSRDLPDVTAKPE